MTDLTGEIKGLINYVELLGLMESRVLEKINKTLRGKKITINSDTYNGQPFGTSKSKMKGKSFIFHKNDWVSIQNGEIYVCPPNTRCSLSLKNCIVSNK